MWASIEKWAYPEWSFPLLVEHPSMTLGFDPEFFMRAAGAIEFALAFALMWTPLVRRVGAIMLAAHVRQRGVRIRQDRHDRTHADRGGAVGDHRRQRAASRELVRHLPWLIPAAYAYRARAIPRGAITPAHALLFGTSITSTATRAT